MERDYYPSIDSLKFFAVACFMFFVFGITGGVGDVIRYCLSFAVPLLYMTFGFTILGENEDRCGIIKRSLFRNLAVFGASVIIFSIISMIYLYMNGVELVFTAKSIVDFLVFGKWQLPIGTLVWFSEQLVIALAIFLFLSKSGLLSHNWFVYLLIVLTLAVNIVFGEFSRLFGLGYLPNCFFNNAVPFMLIGKLIKDRERQVFDLGPLISLVTFVLGLLITFGEMMMFNYFTRFNFTSNFLGSILCAIGLMMLAVQFSDFGETSGLSYWGGGCAPWMFLLAEPVSLFVSLVMPTTEYVFYLLTPFIIFLASLFISLIITAIIHLIVPRPALAADADGNEEDEEEFTDEFTDENL